MVEPSAVATEEEAAAAAALHEDGTAEGAPAAAAEAEASVDSDIELEESFSAIPKSFASLFTDDEEVEVGEVDPSLLLVNCGLSDATIRALEARGIASLFAIQKTVFEPAMAGSDLIARAKTGSGEGLWESVLGPGLLACTARMHACAPAPQFTTSRPLRPPARTHTFNPPAGKTLAFGIPVVEKILAAGKGATKGKPQCLVLAPTRELAKQVEREIGLTAPSLNVGCFYGGAPIGLQARWRLAAAAAPPGLPATAVLGCAGCCSPHCLDPSTDRPRVARICLSSSCPSADQGPAPRRGHCGGHARPHHRPD